MDPEPGRCRRTDGKKWRCSRDVVAGQKYCERHMHRGRSRSRKPVEFPVPTATATSAAATSALADGGADAARGVGGGGVSVVGPTSAAASAVPCDSIFSLSGTTASVDTLHFNQGSSESRPVKKKGPFEPQHEASDDNDRVLRHFFDDWPRSIQDTNATGSSSRATSAMHLSISAPGNPCPDFLKLSTGGNEDEPGGRPGLHWTAARWAAGGGLGQATPVGGPLAEALRSSSNSSPTSVLHQTLRCSASGSRFVST
ncbi:hypothetical protein Nepgr_011788 [Nepenthes gracilis]|uniref:Growth-regulating factor n=1 Tax=Nepenthes gracilis TaxID=150966 RepID=A0AAD3SG47_NEPGR|nr:hypothetical protein Nepgr_011788 [Nepenthes gracilis]